MVSKATAVDFGSSSVKALTVRSGKHGFVLERFRAYPSADAEAGLGSSGMSLKSAVVGLAGREMTLRYTQVPPSPDWQLRNLMELEIQDLSSQSGGDLSADYNLLPIEDEEGGNDTVLLAFARNDALERVSSSLAAAGGSVAGHVPNCVAIYNAFLSCGPVDEDATVCIVNLGRETIDLAIVRGVDLLFVRNLSSGGKVFDDAIAAAFDVSARKAESLKKDLLDLDPSSRGRYASGQAEKVTVAAGGAGAMLASAIQSSLAFCRNQTKDPQLALDRVLICGGSSRVRGIKGMLREALRCPVDAFDPFERVDLSSLPPEDVEALARHRAEAVVALGLAVGQLDDSLYQLAILPEAVKRRQRFVKQTVWNLAAALVGVALLLLVAIDEREKVAQADEAIAVLSRNRVRAQQIDSQATELVAANDGLQATLGQLAERAIALDGPILVLRAIQDVMPEEFWLTRLEVQQRAETGGRRRQTTAPRPLVIVAGAGKDVSGRGVGDAYLRFLNDMKAQATDGQQWSVTPVKTGTDAEGNDTFEWQIDLRPEPAPAEQ